MERRVTSHSEEQELNQRRRLLNQARKGDPKAINRLFELYQVRVYSGDSLKKQQKNLPSRPVSHSKSGPGGRKKAPVRRSPQRSTRVTARKTTKKVSHR